MPVDKQKIIAKSICPEVITALENHSGDLEVTDLIDLHDSMDPTAENIIRYTLMSDTTEDFKPYRVMVVGKTLEEIEKCWEDAEWSLDLQDKENRKRIFSQEEKTLTQEERVYKFYWCLKTKMSFGRIPMTEISSKNSDFESNIKDYWKNTIIPQQKADLS